VSVVIPGARNAEQMRENAAAADSSFPRPIWKKLPICGAAALPASRHLGNHRWKMSSLIGLIHKKLAVLVTVMFEVWSDGKAPPYSPMTTSLKPGRPIFWVFPGHSYGGRTGSGDS
jgi:hypothetical protein